jgi:integrase
MKRQEATAAAVTKVKGQWPIDLSSYDRLERLRHTEISVFENFYHQLNADPNIYIRRLKKPLHRLFQPIYDLLTHAKVRGVDMTHSDVVRVLCREMYLSKLSYWGWTQSQWATLLQPNAKGYAVHNELTRGNSRSAIIAIAYIVGNFSELDCIGKFHRDKIAYKVFGRETVIPILQRVVSHAESWGNIVSGPDKIFPNLVCAALLENRSPFLEDLTLDVLDKLSRSNIAAALKQKISLFSLVLKDFGIVNEYIDHRKYRNLEIQSSETGVPEDWAHWCNRWFNTSTYELRSRKNSRSILHRIGHWLGKEYPEFTNPDKWDQEMAATFVAAVDRLNIGDWAGTKTRIDKSKIGKPLSPRAKAHYIGVARTFFIDCQEWRWIRPHFNPGRSLALPRTLRSLIGPSPRNIADDLWAKLLWAGLNLAIEDLPLGSTFRMPMYPLEMVRALAIVWLFAGLRSDEIYRLRLGCIRWQREDVTIPGTDSTLAKDAVCWLDVPVNKTGKSFTKPVDKYVGDAVEAWEAVMPMQPANIDTKTNERVSFLFSYRGHVVGVSYINNTLIPVLCKKAGIPQSDVRGPITSHRARSTIASQLFNCKEPMSLWELKEWLGHRWMSSTEYYIRTSPTRLAKAYSDAGYFGRNIRTIEVLIDKDAVTSGAAAAGKPWSFYDLGPGYCTNDYFVTCPHRMACPKCNFYVPKDSTQGQLLEGKSNLLRMRQEIPLTEEELAAVDEGVEALEKLCEKLANVPTPAGPTPQQLVQISRLDGSDSLQKGQIVKSLISKQ